METSDLNRIDRKSAIEEQQSERRIDQFLEIWLPWNINIAHILGY
ncbi:conserved protein of unknown function [Candidatus Nitrotoga arctica]|uniref:Uncharacterized protein n=1 Tax=Candidatus Nitrotoga arctica TaxID=453162 RepID=A0ABN8AMV5_9PROT|nr:conserved protein of unknown function [Candidatus Nitrotoga arctica]